MSSVVQGARLAYVVIKLDGKIQRETCKYNRKTGKLEKTPKEEDAGFLVFFPQGHYLRVRTVDDLKRYRLDKKPEIISLQGLLDPKSPVGALMAAQDNDGRAAAYQNLQADVISMCRKRSGPAAVPGYDKKLPLPTHQEELSYA